MALIKHCVEPIISKCSLSCICPVFGCALTLSMPGWGIPPLTFSSKTPGDVKNKLSDFNFTLLTDILRSLSTIVIRCCQ